MAKKDLLRSSQQELIDMIKDGEKANAELSARIVDLENESADKDKIIKDLIGKNNLMAVSKEAKSNVVVKHEDDNYEVVIPRFSLGKTTYVAEDIKNDPELLKKLVEIGSGVIKKIENI